MEANLCKQGNADEEDSTIVEYLKRHDSTPIDEAERPSLARHVLSTPECSHARHGSRYIDVGCLYEIDHKKLPPKYPIQLKAIRVVMVNEKTDLNVSVRFPSTFSLRTYFSRKSLGETDQSLGGKMYPELDEQFVMRSNLANEILVRRISSLEFAKQKHMQSFWLEPSKDSEISTSVFNKVSRDDTLVKGTCWSALNCDGLMHWGVRRRVTFMGRHNDKTPRVPSSSSFIKEEDVAKTDAKAKEETKKKSQKTKHQSQDRNTKTKTAKSEKGKPSSSNINKKLSYDRWSKDRYNNAELKMLEIMKEKGAVYGKPMLRQALRMEARKHIGDTGLLDHLLKHMAGKVAPNGEERFRRRHNADGAMEYWLENADLVSVRREAGVKDPYWTPPPGWKPGDSPSQDPICANELKLLKEDMTNIKRDVQELLALRRKDCGEEANMTTTKSSCNNLKLEYDTTAAAPLHEMYENLVKKKEQIEQQLLEISNSLNVMQDEIGRIASTAEESARSAVIEAEAEAEAVNKENMEKLERGAEEEEKKAAEAEKAAKRQRLKSGFRICKPQGTFLWPNMRGSAGSSSILSPQVALQVEDLLMVPTPPSVSSATSPPLLHTLLTPRQPTSPVKPLAERRRAVTVTVSSIVTPESCEGDNIRSSTALYHHHQHDVANNNNHLQGFCGTLSSSSSHHHLQCTLLSSVRDIARPVAGAVEEHKGHSMAVGSGTTTAVTYKRKQPHVEGKEDTYGGGRTWLALATPNPSFSNS